MKELKFICSWEKTRRRGITLYVLVCMVIILASSLIGKVIGDYVSNGTIFQTLHIQNINALIFVCLIGILTGVYLWHHNETRYNELIKDNNKKKQ